MKLQITITEEEEKLLSQQAKVLGYDVTKYTKFLISHEAMKISQIPVFEMSPKAEAVALKALADDRAGKTKTWKFGQYEN